MTHLLALAAFWLVQPAAIDEARRLADRGQIESAIERLEAEREKTSSAPLLAFLAELQTADDQIPQAAETLTEALALAPEQHRLRTTLGALLVRLRRYEDARRELSRALTVDPKNPMAHYYLAVAHKNEGNVDAALPHAERAVESMPNHPASFVEMDYAPDANALLLLAEIRYLAQDDEAESLLRKVTELDETLPGAHYLLGQSLLRSGRRDEAEAALLAFRRTKRAAEHVERALSYAATPASELAIRELRAALESYPDHPRALYLLARALVRRGELEEAATHLRRVMALRPEASDAIAPLIQQIQGER